MNDRELADAVVALGILREYPPYYRLVGAALDDLTEEEAVRDWRVAGAVMERCAKSQDADTGTITLSFGLELFCATTAPSPAPIYGVYLERSDVSAPRAIIEAGVLALTEHNTTDKEST